MPLTRRCLGKSIRWPWHTRLHKCNTRACASAAMLPQILLSESEFYRFWHLNVGVTQKKQRWNSTAFPFPKAESWRGGGLGGAGPGAPPASAGSRGMGGGSVGGGGRDHVLSSNGPGLDPVPRRSHLVGLPNSTLVITTGCFLHNLANRNGFFQIPLFCKCGFFSFVILYIFTYGMKIFF